MNIWIQYEQQFEYNINITIWAFEYNMNIRIQYEHSNTIWTFEYNMNKNLYTSCPHVHNTRYIFMYMYTTQPHVHLHRFYVHVIPLYLGTWICLKTCFKLYECRTCSSTCIQLEHMFLIHKIIGFAEYRLFYRALLQKRQIMLSILLTKATPYLHVSNIKICSSFIQLKTHVQTHTCT